jgi:hypothetical protein
MEVDQQPQFRIYDLLKILLILLEKHEVNLAVAFLNQIRSVVGPRNIDVDLRSQLRILRSDNIQNPIGNGINIQVCLERLSNICPPRLSAPRFASDKTRRLAPVSLDVLPNCKLVDRTPSDRSQASVSEYEYNWDTNSASERDATSAASAVVQSWSVLKI